MTKKKITKKKDDDDDWIKAAMENDRIVVELLVQIKRAAAVVERLSKAKANADQYSRLPIDWCGRQRRSAINSTPSPSPPLPSPSLSLPSPSLPLPSLPQPLPRRNSPTTALSLSCGGATAGTSASGGVGGDRIGDSSCQIDRKRKDTPRPNKLGVRGGTVVSKKKPRKKTLIELKEEECLLLEERRTLDIDLTALRLGIEEKLAINEILRRQSIGKTRVDLAQMNDSTQEKVACKDPVSSMLVTVTRTPQHEDNVSSIPDLNMPYEDGLTC